VKLSVAAEECLDLADEPVLDLEHFKHNGPVLGIRDVEATIPYVPFHASLLTAKASAPPEQLRLCGAFRDTARCAEY